jgi:hypothetical protein
MFGLVSFWGPEEGGANGKAAHTPAPRARKAKQNPQRANQEGRPGRRANERTSVLAGRISNIVYYQLTTYSLNLQYTIVAYS